MTGIGKLNLAPGAIAMVVIIVALITGGAMFFSEDDLFGALRGSDNTQPAEIRGRWLGMSVISPGSDTAQNWNIPQSVDGVVVAEVAGQTGWRAEAAGLSPGDVIVGIEGQRVHNMTDFIDATGRVDISAPVIVEINRWGQPMTLVMPSPNGQFETNGAVAQGGGIGKAQGFGFGRAGNPLAQGANEEMMSWPQGMSTGLYFCPLHRLGWSKAAVHPTYRCPRCNVPLRQVP